MALADAVTTIEVGVGAADLQYMLVLWLTKLNSENQWASKDRHQHFKFQESQRTSLESKAYLPYNHLALHTSNGVSPWRG